MGNQLSQAPTHVSARNLKIYTRISAERGKQDFASPRMFMEYAYERLRDEGFSETLMDDILGQFHRFADEKLDIRQRGRTHTFLCNFKTLIHGVGHDEQIKVIEKSKKAFLQMDITHLAIPEKHGYQEKRKRIHGKRRRKNMRGR